MQNEIEKLVAYAGAREVSACAVEELVPAPLEDQMFALMDAVSKKDALGAVRMLAQERERSTDDARIFAMLARQIRILLGVRSLLDENSQTTKQEVASTLGVHPFVASKALSQARFFSQETLKKIHTLLFHLDRGAKTGKHGADLAVDRTVAEILKKK